MRFSEPSMIGTADIQKGVSGIAGPRSRSALRGATMSDPSIWRSADAPRVSFVIPTLNEARNLEHVLPQVPTWAHEIILVDGRSTDGTVELARAIRSDVRIILEPRRGKGAALRAGFAAATGEVIVMLDADGSMDPSEAIMFLGALLAGADLVKGSRFVQGGGTTDMPWLRMAGNWALTQLVRLLFGGSYSDLCYGYSAFWRPAIEALSLDSDGFEIETQINVRALRHRLRIAEVPSFERDRVSGEGKLRTFPDGWRVLRTIATEWASGRRSPRIEAA